MSQTLAPDLTSFLNDAVRDGVVQPGDPAYQQMSGAIADLQSGNFAALEAMTIAG